MKNVTFSKRIVEIKVEHYQRVDPSFNSIYIYNVETKRRLLKNIKEAKTAGEKAYHQKLLHDLHFT